VLRNIAGPVMNNDAATKAYVDAADAAQAQHADETYLPKENPAATGELTVDGELTLADALGNEVHVQAGSGNAMVLQGGSNHAGTVEIKVRRTGEVQVVPREACLQTVQSLLTTL
jgi:hypothetical protein